MVRRKCYVRERLGFQIVPTKLILNSYNFPRHSNQVQTLSWYSEIRITQHVTITCFVDLTNPHWQIGE